MNLVCFRSCPPALDPGQWDDWNLRLQQDLLRQGQVFFSLPLWRGQRWLKAVLLNPYTQPDQMHRWFEFIDQWNAPGLGDA
jgi:hypothetical protein